MYTQCPECGAAFRVTAEVLRQAAGKVRCGGCGNAFNALEHLSEEKPRSRPAAPVPKPQLPELKPDPAEPARNAAQTTMSAEQSAALLKTLDELAGSDIRLEDTGIEWRLLDADEAGEPGETPLEYELSASQPSLLDAELSADLESRRVDEVLSSSPTPVDELLPAAGETAVDSPEVFDASASQTFPDEELRFDDNTGLPDDYDGEASGERQRVVPEPSHDAPEPMANLQVDLGFDDPDEWQDLLVEVGQEDDETPPAGDELANQMEALSLELTGIQEQLDDLADETAEPGIIDEHRATEGNTDEPEDGELSAVDVDGDEPDIDEVAAGKDDDEAGPETADLPEDEEAIDVELASAEVDALADDDETATDDPDAIDPAAIDNKDDSAVAAVEPEDEGGDAAGFDFSLLQADDDSAAIEMEAEEPEGQDVDIDADDEVIAGDESARAMDDDSGAEDAATSIDEDLFAAAFDAEADTEHREPAVPIVEPLSEEEQTINMMIDQDLLSIAVTDDDGFASTIVGTKESFDAALADAESESDAGQTAPDTTSLPADSGVETIIMSGDSARSIREAARAEALKEEAAAMIAAAKAEEAKQQKQALNWRLVAGIAALALLLTVQAIHFSRDGLARIPVLHDVLAPIYAMIGMPLAPDWEVTGWRVEKTKGSVDASGETLNIYAEIGNLAGSAMPYPVIGVSLLDRFEESIGSRIFEPGEYLAGNIDRLGLVGTGQRFSAEMTIESPAVAASGFRLNVCYRQSGSQLRCAIEDFR